MLPLCDFLSNSHMGRYEDTVGKFHYGFGFLLYEMIALFQCNGFFFSDLACGVLLEVTY